MSAQPLSPRPDDELRTAIEAVELMGCLGNHKVGYCPVVLVEKREVLAILRAALSSPETTPAGVLPPVTPIPGLEHMRSAMDVFTPEERADLFDQLERLARERRAGEFEAGKLRLP